MAYIRKMTLKNGDIRWRAEIRLTDHPNTSEIFETKEDAELWSSSLETALKSGATSSYTMSQVFDRYEKEILINKSQYQKVPEKRHISFWRDHLSDQLITDVTSLEVERLSELLLQKVSTKTGELFSPEHQRKYLMTLSYIFNVCCRDWKLSSSNPVTFVSKPKSLNINKNKTEIPKDLIEIKIYLIDQLKQSMSKLRNPTIKGLAREVGVSFETIRRALNPHEDITLRNIYKIFSSLNVEVKLVFREN